MNFQRGIKKPVSKVDECRSTFDTHGRNEGLLRELGSNFRLLWLSGGDESRFN
jgi:hypothetical protein